MIPRLFAVLVVSAAVVACAAPAATDNVQTADQAIDIAKKVCDYSPYGVGKWSAKFKMGKWIVRFDVPGDLVPGDPYALVNVNARTGRTDGCGGSGTY